VGGECYAYVFENPRMGVARGLFWNFILECAPVAWDGEEWDTSLLCDWVTMPNRNWNDPAEVSLREIPKRDLLEASFHLSEHHSVKLSRLEIAHREKGHFRVRVGGTFDLTGYGELDAADIPFDLEGQVHFKGLIVMRNNLFPKPSTSADAIAVASAFLNLDGLSAPEFDGDRFLFEPVRDAV
jgi:hypothetical protein